MVKRVKKKRGQKRNVLHEAVKGIDEMEEVDEDVARVMGILCADDEDEMEVTAENLELYFNYLNENIDLSAMVTGWEDFKWEEYYVLGPGDQAEYEELKKTRPSYTDKYEILSLDDCDFDYGVLVNVRRLSDKKKFSLPLADLKAVEKNSKNFQILADYAMWYVNYR
jgi:hypothetical protein